MVGPWKRVLHRSTKEHLVSWGSNCSYWVNKEAVWAAPCTKLLGPEISVQTFLSMHVAFLPFPTQELVLHSRPVTKTDTSICRTLPCQRGELWVWSKFTALSECGRHVHFHPQQVFTIVNSLALASPQAQVPKPQFLLIADDKSFCRESSLAKLLSASG